MSERTWDVHLVEFESTGLPRCSMTRMLLLRVFLKVFEGSNEVEMTHKITSVTFECLKR